MNAADLQSPIAKGEDSRLQFKVNATNAESLASEMAAFANSDGGTILRNPILVSYGSAVGSEKSSEKIIRLVKDDPAISAAEIALRIGVTSRAVEKQLAALRKAGAVRRIGPDRGGRWEVSQ